MGFVVDLILRCHRRERSESILVEFKDLKLTCSRYSIRVGRSKSPSGPFVDRDGTDMKKGGGSIVYGSHGYVYGPGGQGVLKNYKGRDVLYFHYGLFALVFFFNS